MRLVRCMRAIGVAATVAGLAAANHSAEAAANEPVEDARTTWADDVPAKAPEIQQLENADVSALQFGNLESDGGLPQAGGVANGRVVAENLTIWKNQVRSDGCRDGSSRATATCGFTRCVVESISGN